MSLRIIAVVLIGTLIVRINSLEHEVSENEVWSIKCPSMGDGIEIVDAKWAYDRASISNMFTPNIRNYAFVWGAYLNMCTWDVSTGMKSRCALENECIFTPTREALGDCGYKMYLRVRYECRNDIETQQKLSSDQRCYHIKDYNEYAEEFNYCSDWHSRHKRQSPDDDDPSQRCTILFGIMDVAASHTFIYEYVGGNIDYNATISTWRRCDNRFGVRDESENYTDNNTRTRRFPRKSCTTNAWAGRQTRSGRTV